LQLSSLDHQKEHRPKSHQAHLEWTPSRMVHWAEQTRPNTARLIERILSGALMLIVVSPILQLRSATGPPSWEKSLVNVSALSGRGLLAGSTKVKWFGIGYVAGFISGLVVK